MNWGRSWKILWWRTPPLVEMVVCASFFIVVGGGSLISSCREMNEHTKLVNAAKVPVLEVLAQQNARIKELEAQLAQSQPSGRKDVTKLVDFGDNDGESLPLTKCVCGARFPLWEEIVGIYPEHPWECPTVMEVQP